jgi:hypothetical protein
MFVIDENNQTPDFSDIPALGDSQGLENYLNNEALASQGLPTQEKPAAQAPATEQPAEQPAQQPAPAPADTITLTREQLNAILASRGQAPQQGAQAPVQRPVQPQQPQQSFTGYSQQERTFIANALAKGYSLEQINNVLNNQGRRLDPAMEQRIAAVENYLKTQEYKSAENAFINKLSDFGNKWGLSEQDLVVFGNEALKHGINIAVENVNLETVFRAVYPEQYAIRSRRMAPTSSSQIYGGTSIPESSRASTSKLEDAYVESFLKGAMPNQYAALNKK